MHHQAKYTDFWAINVEIVPFLCHSFFQFLLSSSSRCASHLCGHSLPANRCLSRGEQILFGVTSFGLLVNQGGKHAWPVLTRLVGNRGWRESKCRRNWGGDWKRSKKRRIRKSRRSGGKERNRGVERWGGARNEKEGKTLKYNMLCVCPNNVVVCKMYW